MLSSLPCSYAFADLLSLHLVTFLILVYVTCHLLQSSKKKKKKKKKMMKKKKKKMMMKKKKKRKKKKNFADGLATFWFSTFAMPFSATGCAVHHENTRR